MQDFIAAIKQDTLGTHQGVKDYDLKAGETYRIERAGNGGVYIETVIGEVLVAFPDFSLVDLNAPDCLNPETGDPRDTSIDVVRLAVSRG